ncbi:coiled-coil domain-containing protein 88B isoform X2 [Amia ocellicauda]
MLKSSIRHKKPPLSSHSSTARDVGSSQPVVYLSHSTSKGKPFHTKSGHIDSQRYRGHLLQGQKQWASEQRDKKRQSLLELEEAGGHRNPWQPLALQASSGSTGLVLQKDATQGSVFQEAAEILEEQLQQGYQEEALLLRRSLESIRQQYVIRLQGLESEVRTAERERERARRESRAARAEQQALLQEHGQLLHTLRRVREKLEQQEVHRRQYTRNQEAPPALHKTRGKQGKHHPPH